MNGLKPMMFLREKAVEPRYDTMEGAIILKRTVRAAGYRGVFPL
ncbi:MAG: hypothetical protein U5K27_10285 [Desulfotignum sp.]|nr:hypothetical protein [Desulfotignum sp.]